MRDKPYIVGLTGGIGSGKSTVASLFSALGAATVDTDAIAHALTARHGRAIVAIRALMGADLISPDGSLDRRATRQRVFSDDVAKSQLESILHPLIHEEVEVALGAPAVKLAPYTLLVVPLLFESNIYRARARSTLLVDCGAAHNWSECNDVRGLDSMRPRESLLHNCHGRSNCNWLTRSSGMGRLCRHWASRLNVSTGVTCNKARRRYE